MLKFDGEEITALVQRKRVLNGLNILFLVVIIVESLIVAVLSKDAESNWGLYIALYVQVGVFIVLYVLYLIFFLTKAGRELKYAICKTIAEGFYAQSKILEGGGNVNFSVKYEKTVLTVSRMDRSGEIIIYPDSVKGLEAIGGRGKLELDISALKPLSSVYSSAGTYLLEFFQAYYRGGAGGAPDTVTISDETGKRPIEFLIVEDGKPCSDRTNNYFLKKGLVK